MSKLLTPRKAKLAPPQTFLTKKFSFSQRKMFQGPQFQGPPPSPPPPPPPPLKFDVIIAKVYGPTANLYTDILEVSPTASQEEFKVAYRRIRNQTQEKLAELSNNSSILERNKTTKANRKKHLVMQINAITEAYQIVSDAQKKKEYDESIGLQVNDYHHGGLLNNMSQRHVDLKSRMDQYLETKPNNDRSMDYDDYVMNESCIMSETSGKKGEQPKKVKFSDKTNFSKQTSKNLPLASPTGVSEFDDSLYDQAEDLQEKISPIARLRRKEKPISRKDKGKRREYDDHDDDDDWTNCTDDERELSYCETGMMICCSGMGIFDLITEEVFGRSCGRS